MEIRLGNKPIKSIICPQQPDESWNYANRVYYGGKQVFPPLLPFQGLSTLTYNRGFGLSGAQLDSVNSSFDLAGWSTNIGGTTVYPVDRMYSTGIIKSPFSTTGTRVTKASGASTYRSGNCYTVDFTNKTFSNDPIDEGYRWHLYTEPNSQAAWGKLGALPSGSNTTDGLGFALRYNATTGYAIFFKLVKGNKWKIYRAKPGASNTTDVDTIVEGSYSSSTWGGAIPAVNDFIWVSLCSSGATSEFPNGMDHIKFSFKKNPTNVDDYFEATGAQYSFYNVTSDNIPNRTLFRYSGKHHGPAFTTDNAGSFRSFSLGHVHWSWK